EPEGAQPDAKGRHRSGDKKNDERGTHRGRREQDQAGNQHQVQDGRARLIQFAGATSPPVIGPPGQVQFQRQQKGIGEEQEPSSPSHAYPRRGVGKQGGRPPPTQAGGQQGRQEDQPGRGQAKPGDQGQTNTRRRMPQGRQRPAPGQGMAEKEQDQRK